MLSPTASWVPASALHALLAAFKVRMRILPFNCKQPLRFDERLTCIIMALAQDLPQAAKSCVHWSELCLVKRVVAASCTRDARPLATPRVSALQCMHSRIAVPYHSAPMQARQGAEDRHNAQLVSASLESGGPPAFVTHTMAFAQCVRFLPCTDTGRCCPG